MEIKLLLRRLLLLASDGAATGEYHNSNVTIKVSVAKKMVTVKLPHAGSGTWYSPMTVISSESVPQPAVQH